MSAPLCPDCGRAQVLDQGCGFPVCLDCRERCGCGSGEYRRELVDARGIFCGYVCDACEPERRAGYRPEIFSDSGYECDEEIDGEPDLWTWPGGDL